MEHEDRTILLSEFSLRMGRAGWLNNSYFRFKETQKTRQNSHMRPWWYWQKNCCFLQGRGVKRYWLLSANLQIRQLSVLILSSATMTYKKMTFETNSSVFSMYISKFSFFLFSFPLQFLYSPLFIWCNTLLPSPFTISPYIPP